MMYKFKCYGYKGELAYSLFQIHTVGFIFL